ncbi:MAG: hypothetical protein WC805_00540 [Patescibacteria group bacterium]
MEISDVLFYVILFLLLIMAEWVNFGIRARTEQTSSPATPPVLPSSSENKWEDTEDLCQIAQVYSSHSQP